METPYFTYYQSPIGILKIAGNDQYINAITFVDDEAELETEAHPNLLVTQCAEQLIEYFNGRRNNFDIPVNQDGTTFQQRVWSELLQVRFGKTISYMDLAKRLGDPKCIRAAASTNGKNKLCILVPCHRIIGSNQSLVGYAGGLWRKKWLLAHENKIANGVQTLF